MTEPNRRSSGVISGLPFAAAILVSAALLFMVQPMVGKAMLPLLGGTPSTWTTCMLFFQVSLLAGYCYADLTSMHLRPSRQAMAHCGLLVIAAFVVPLQLSPTTPPGDGSPVVWLLMTLAGTAGIPFFTVAATAPLVQRWFALATGREPYFLYATSNVGSLLGLLMYPLLVERLLNAAEQQALWRSAFTVLAASIAACLAVAWNAPGFSAPPARKPGWSGGLRPSIPRKEKAAWVLLAFVPSSLLMGVTSYLSTDVAAVPLLWVTPLAIYLLTYVAAFASRPLVSPQASSRLSAFLLVGATLALVTPISARWGVAIHLSTFAVAALMCHRQLADRRPDASSLTQYYLFISAGGALGGLFNAIVAPLAFQHVLEYPVMLIAAALLRPPPGWRLGFDDVRPLLVAVGAAAVSVIFIAPAAGLVAVPDRRAAGVAILILLCIILVWSNRPRSFAVAMASVLGASALGGPTTGGTVLYQGRSFFGVHRVSLDPATGAHRLFHGTTLHGYQIPGSAECVPTGYYSVASPIGQVFSALPPAAARIGVIGLGAGTLACYARPGSQWTFFEVDPLVKRIATDPSLFTFLASARGDIDVVIGDGRLRLADTAAGTFDLVVVDAFGSDSVPVHLITAEFLETAIDRLRPGGLLAVHISSRFLNLEPVLAATAAEVGAESVTRFHEPEGGDGIASQWTLVARHSELLKSLAMEAGWKPGSTGGRAWTDDYSNLLDAMRWAPVVGPAARDVSGR